MNSREKPKNRGKVIWENRQELQPFARGLSGMYIRLSPMIENKTKKLSRLAREIMTLSRNQLLVIYGFWTRC